MDAKNIKVEKLITINAIYNLKWRHSICIWYHTVKNSLYILIMSPLFSYKDDDTFEG